MATVSQPCLLTSCSLLPPCSSLSPSRDTKSFSAIGPAGVYILGAETDPPHLLQERAAFPHTSAQPSCRTCLTCPTLSLGLLLVSSITPCTLSVSSAVSRGSCHSSVPSPCAYSPPAHHPLQFSIPTGSAEVLGFLPCQGERQGLAGDRHKTPRAQENPVAPESPSENAAVTG